MEITCNIDDIVNFNFQNSSGFRLYIEEKSLIKRKINYFIITNKEQENGHGFLQETFIPKQLYLKLILEGIKETMKFSRPFYHFSPTLT